MRTHRNILAALGWALVGCSNETVAQVPPAPVDWQSLQVHPVVDAGSDVLTAKERALADAYASALASPGFAPLGPLLDDEAHFASPGMEDAHGRSPVVHAHDVLLGAFDDRQVTPSRVWRTPSEQTFEWTLTGTHARDWMGVAATHKPVAFKGLTLLWTKDDGSITDVHVYVDVALVKAQLGVGPKDLLSLSPVSRPVGPAQVFEQTGSANEPNHLALVQSWLDALENAKESAYVGAVTDDVEVDTLERPQPARGKEAARAYYKAMHKAIGQLDTTVENGFGVAQFALVEYSIAGEQIGPIGWIPAQRDKVIRLELVDICEITGGKIARVWRYDNPTQIWSGSGP
jgi:hypothetical protein